VETPAPEASPESTEAAPDTSKQLVLVPDTERPPLAPAESATPESSPVSTPAPAPLIASTNPPSFSVPVIKSLESGSVYLQMGAFRYPTMIESELNKIGRNYPLVIEETGSWSATLYKILIGPMTEGEAQALRPQMQAAGWPDTYIRR
jgi:hypothetical protein